jgi:hypothetical protein
MMTNRIRSLATLLFLVAATAGLASAAPYEPASGSAERRDILDALRPAVEGVLRPPVEFRVSRLRVDGGWAFAQLEPQRPGGGAIDAAALELDTDMMDGLTTWALLKEQGGGWTLVDWALGPTDVAWWGWWDTYGAPRGIFPQ